MKPLPSQQVKCVCGCDYIRDVDGLPDKRTEKGWNYYAERLVSKKNKAQKFQWAYTLPWIEHRECFRLNFCGQEER